MSGVRSLPIDSINRLFGIYSVQTEFFDTYFPFIPHGQRILSDGLDSY